MMLMSITCDGCSESAGCATDYDSGANEIDGMLESGWVHRGSEDFCPACVASGAGDN